MSLINVTELNQKLTFTLQERSVVTLFNKNAEKNISYLIRLILGMGTIDSGQVQILDNKFDHNNLNLNYFKIDWRKKIGFASDTEGLLSNLTIKDNIFLPLRYHGDFESEYKNNPEQILNELEIASTYWNLRPYEVPSIIIKKALLARSMILSPKILILENPTRYFPMEKWPFLINLFKKNLSSNTGILITSDEATFVNLLKTECKSDIVEIDHD
ncbi:MAG: ATP-binding cassette domain-containing protein [Bacteriovoracaceae bacterium]